MIKLKHWWKSFTVWLGALVVAISQIPPDLISMMHPDAKDWIYTVIGGALIWTRLFSTNQAITETAANKPVADDKSA